MSELKEFTFVMVVKDKNYEKTIDDVKDRLAYQIGARIADTLSGNGEYRVTLHWCQTYVSYGKGPEDREIQLRGSIYKVERQQPSDLCRG